MLVITRKKGEKILVGDDVVITVLQINRSRIKIGVDAPEKVRVRRDDCKKEPSLPAQRKQELW